MEQSTSLPHTSQPVGDCRANSSIRGRSPPVHNFLPDNIGFLLCPLWVQRPPDEHLQSGASASLSLQASKALHLRVSSSHAPKQRRCLFVLLYPCESDCFIGEAPSINDGKCFAQSRECHPHKQDAVFICQFSDREISDVIYAHGRVVRFGGTSRTFL